MFKDKKTLLYGGVLVVVLGLAYYVFFAGSSSTPPITTSTEDPTSTVSRDLLTTLTSLNSIRLDESLFVDPVFVSLSDFGVVIPEQPFGRRNPFAPL